MWTVSSLDAWRGPEFTRLFAAARRALERGGPVPAGGAPDGRVGLTGPDEAERRALIGITGRYQPAGVRRMTVELADLDALLRSSVGLGLEQAVVELHGRPLRHRALERAGLEVRRRAALAEVQGSVLYESRAWFRTWAEEVSGAVLTRLLNQDAQAKLTDAVRVLELVETRRGEDHPYLLPALAEQVTGDTKALGRGTPTATLVLGALAGREGCRAPHSAEEERELWDACGVVVDDLASRVLVLNLAADGEGLGEWLSGAARYGTPFQVTLHQLTAHPLAPRVAAPRTAEVFVCENPAVLRRAAQVLGPRCPTLLCTEGRPSTAFHRLARALTTAGAVLRYHGDYDWPGLSIAEQVIRMHGATPWLMDERQYREHARRGPESRPLSGTPVPAPWSPGLAAALGELGVAVYEEAVADELLADLERTAIVGQAGR
jgi:uncharacterized protein (TIGR02679 family)